MRKQLFDAIGWVTAAHIRHFQALSTLHAQIGAQFMRWVNPELSNYYEASIDQAMELQELKAIDAAYSIRDLAMKNDGWEDHHSIGLNMLSSVFMDQLDWHPEDVSDFVDRLTEGHFRLGSVEDED